MKVIIVVGVDEHQPVAREIECEPVALDSGGDDRLYVDAVALGGIEIDAVKRGAGLVEVVDVTAYDSLYGDRLARVDDQVGVIAVVDITVGGVCLLYTSPSPRD